MPDVTPAEPLTFAQALEALRGKARAFVLAYLTDPKTRFNATQSALKAGYSEKTAYSIGHENLRKPEIRLAINLALEEAGMSPQMALARLEEHASATLEEFLSFRTWKYRPSVEMPRWEARDWLELEISKREGMLLEMLSSPRSGEAQMKPDPDAERELRNDISYLRRSLERINTPDKSGKLDDLETVGIPGNEVEEVKAHLDLEKARQAGKLHLLRKLKWGQHGPEVELHPVQEALVTVLRKHGALVERKDLTSGGAPIKFIKVEEDDL